MTTTSSEVSYTVSVLYTHGLKYDSMLKNMLFLLVHDDVISVVEALREEEEQATKGGGILFCACALIAKMTPIDQELRFLNSADAVSVFSLHERVEIISLLPMKGNA